MYVYMYMHNYIYIYIYICIIERDMLCVLYVYTCIYYIYIYIYVYSIRARYVPTQVRVDSQRNHEADSRIVRRDGGDCIICTFRASQARRPACAPQEVEGPYPGQGGRRGAGDWRAITQIQDTIYIYVFIHIYIYIYMNPGCVQYV